MLCIYKSNAVLIILNVIRSLTARGHSRHPIISDDQILYFLTFFVVLNKRFKVIKYNELGWHSMRHEYLDLKENLYFPVIRLDKLWLCSSPDHLSTDLGWFQRERGGVRQRTRRWCHPKVALWNEGDITAEELLVSPVHGTHTHAHTYTLTHANRKQNPRWRGSRIRHLGAELEVLKVAARRGTDGREKDDMSRMDNGWTFFK